MEGSQPVAVAGIERVQQVKDLFSPGFRKRQCIRALAQGQLDQVSLGDLGHIFQGRRSGQQREHIVGEFRVGKKPDLGGILDHQHAVIHGQAAPQGCDQGSLSHTSGADHGDRKAGQDCAVQIGSQGLIEDVRELKVRIIRHGGIFHVPLDDPDWRTVLFAHFDQAIWFGNYVFIHVPGLDQVLQVNACVARDPDHGRGIGIGDRLHYHAVAVVVDGRIHDGFDAVDRSLRFCQGGVEHVQQGRLVGEGNVRALPLVAVDHHLVGAVDGNILDGFVFQ